jgi:DNA (cytosine-5-)-methyltransferase
VIRKTIRYIALFSGIGGFREGLSRAGDFICIGHCEIDKKANQSYEALFDTKGEWFCEDIRKADPADIPDFDLLCGGFPCQSFSIAGNRGGFDDPRGTLFFEIARLTAAKRPAYLLLENVPGLLNHDGGRTFTAILHALDGLGYGLEWQVLNSKDFHVPQSRKRVYLIGYLDERCRGKIFPFTETAGTSLIQVLPGAQGERVYSPEGVSCTLAAQTGGFGGKTGLYEVGLPIKENTKKGYKMAYPGDSINLAYAQQNTRRGRVGRKIAHTLTTNSDQGTLEARAVLTPERETVRQRGRRIKNPGEAMFTLTAQDRYGILHQGRIRRLTPRECLRLQGWRDERIDIVLSIQSDAQLYKQAGNGVTVTVVEAIGKRLAATHREVTAID